MGVVAPHQRATAARPRQPQRPLRDGSHLCARHQWHGARCRQPLGARERAWRCVPDDAGVRPLSARGREHPRLVGVHGLDPSVRRSDDHGPRDAQPWPRSAHALDHEGCVRPQPDVSPVCERRGRQSAEHPADLLLSGPHAFWLGVELLLRAGQHQGPHRAGRRRDERLRRHDEPVSVFARGLLQPRDAPAGRIRALASSRRCGCTARG